MEPFVAVIACVAAVSVLALVIVAIAQVRAQRKPASNFKPFSQRKL